MKQKLWNTLLQWNPIQRYNMFLYNYSNNEYSQHGEDGILKEIFKRLEVPDTLSSWAVEFGAWDGKYLSNAFALVLRGWSVVMIEGDEEKYKDLLDTAKEYPLITPIQAWISQFDYQDKSLYKLLQQTNCPKDFELLSIDIDSYDSDVWDTFHTYTPKVVIIETNSSAPVGVKWRHHIPAGEPISKGSTFTTTLEIGMNKGYTLVHYTGNAIFVRNDLISKLNVPQQILDNPNILKVI